jgi:hypothetical protein
LRQAISAFYKRELQCGDGSEAHLVERSPGVFLLSVHIKDMAMLRLEFEGSTLKRRVGNPNIHMVLEYAKSTGVVRTLVRGGAKYQQMLVEAFAEHVLGVKASAHKIKSPTWICRCCAPASMCRRRSRTDSRWCSSRHSPSSAPTRA